MKKIIYLINTRANRSRVKHQSKKCNSIIVLMSLPNPIHSIIAVLAMPNGNADRGERAKVIINAAEISTYVATPAPVIAELNAKKLAYNNATPSTRDAKYRVLKTGLQTLMGTFQTAADADPENAIAIIESGGFRVKQVAIPQQREFKATNGAESGTIDLVAKGGPASSCHDWMYSADNITFVRMQPTVGGSTIKDGLLPTTYAYFMHQLITNRGPQGWSQVIKILVK